MNLKEVRTQFVKSSGRYDLITGDFVDAGTDYYINSGQRLLDLLQDTPHTKRWHYEVTAAGTYFINMKYIRSLEDVWIANSAAGRSHLTEKPLQWVRDNYTTETTSIDRGLPVYFCKIPVGVSPELIGVASATFLAAGMVDYGHLHESTGLFKGEGEYAGILILPPADGVYTVEVLARFFTAALSADTDTTYWSMMHPDILVLASQCSLEEAYGNREGVRERMESIRGHLRLIDLDLAAYDEDEKLTQMQSSWRSHA